MNLYNNEFYENRHRNTVYSAEIILSIVGEVLPRIASAVDVGCGVGTWLNVLKERGATDIQGIDGDWVNRDFLRIPSEDFLEHDLNRSIKLNKKFDLAISLEVAEHIEPDNARNFVSSLASLSDFMLFSAAIPNQGGVGHLNEQWPDYWISLFRDEGFVGMDIVRKRIWDDESIPFWYRQNILLFVKETRIPDVKVANLSDTIPGELYLMSFKRAMIPPNIMQSLQYLFKAVKRRIKRAFSSG